MSDPRVMQPVSTPLCGTVRPPGSKSLTNRALVVAALADGQTRLTGVLDSRDTTVMIESLKRLGIRVDHDPQQAVATIVGFGGTLPAAQAELWLENSGTSIRFLTALCCTGQGRFRLDGNARMRERPIGELVAALRQLGCDVQCEFANQCPPVLVAANGIAGGTACVGGNLSSQYLSALLMAAPAATGPVAIEVSGRLVSEPYVEMTLTVMRAFGIAIDVASASHFRLSPQTYRACDYNIEPDASAASYFFAAAAITGGEVTVSGLTRGAVQGDVAFVEALARMGCEVEYGSASITVRGRSLHGIDIDMNAISDTAQTLAAVAPFARGPTRIRNIAHARHKETDRIAAVATELRRIGQHVVEHPDGLTIEPAPIQPATIETYDDHRMAMSFALIGLRAPGICIAHPECTAKTYPRFFDDLQQLCGTGERRPET
ncbi:MAG: 3-phosphoshikimate 1-carboxyvinyltransferase [Planctomycetaceae bacterium]|nr:3-phosphoshikimate 1-carboxyvinyltransferase [Planctomycetaceae bacterium]